MLDTYSKIAGKSNFTLLRLIFATLVLLAHSSELIDGTRAREPLTQIFQTLSLGELSVDGFFLLSGFLIVKSWDNHPCAIHFFRNRILRIYPAFIIASVLCLVIVGPLAGNPHNYFAQAQPLSWVMRTLSLETPAAQPVFQGSKYAQLNGSMWTIRYEFYCYILVGLFGIFGFFRYIYVWPTIAAAFLMLLEIYPSSVPLLLSLSGFTLLDLSSIIRLFAMFMGGGSFYLLRARIHYTNSAAFASLLLLMILMYSPRLAEPALIIFGGYCLLWLAFKESRLLTLVVPQADISYGVYLYGWPVQKLLILYVPSIRPWQVFITSCSICYALGWLSWNLIERKLLALKARKCLSSVPHAQEHVVELY